MVNSDRRAFVLGVLFSLTTLTAAVNTDGVRGILVPAGTSVTYPLSLGSLSDAPATIFLASNNPNVTVAPQGVAFDATNWNSPVTITLSSTATTTVLLDFPHTPSTTAVFGEVRITPITIRQFNAARQQAFILALAKAALLPQALIAITSISAVGTSVVVGYEITTASTSESSSTLTALAPLMVSTSTTLKDLLVATPTAYAGSRFTQEPLYGAALFNVSTATLTAASSAAPLDVPSRTVVTHTSTASQAAFTQPFAYMLPATGKALVRQALTTTFTIGLTRQPASTLQVFLASDSFSLPITPTVLTFQPATWFQTQQITLSALPGAAFSPSLATITLTNDGGDAPLTVPVQAVPAVQYSVRPTSGRTLFTTAGASEPISWTAYPRGGTADFISIAPAGQAEGVCAPVVIPLPATGNSGSANLVMPTTPGRYIIRLMTLTTDAVADTNALPSTVSACFLQGANKFNMAAQWSVSVQASLLSVPYFDAFTGSGASSPAFATTTDATLEAWIRLESLSTSAALPATRLIACKCSAAFDGLSMSLKRRVAGGPFFLAVTGRGSGSSPAGAGLLHRSPLSDGLAWHHVAVTVSSPADGSNTTLTAYVDGFPMSVAFAHATPLPSPLPSTPLHLGALASTLRAGAAISHLRLWSSARTAAQLRSDSASATLPTATAGLVGQWPLTDAAPTGSLPWTFANTVPAGLSLSATGVAASLRSLPFAATLRDAGVPSTLHDPIEATCDTTFDELVSAGAGFVAPTPPDTTATAFDIDTVAVSLSASSWLNNTGGQLASCAADGQFLQFGASTRARQITTRLIPSLPLGGTLSFWLKLGNTPAAPAASTPACTTSAVQQAQSGSGYSLSLPAPAAGTTAVAVTLPLSLAMPDNAAATATLTPDGPAAGALPVPAFTVASVTVTVVNLRHAMASDVTLRLTSGATSVTLVAAACSTGGPWGTASPLTSTSFPAGLDYTFADGGAALACPTTVGTPIAAGTYAPSQPLSAFAGQLSSAAWRVELADSTSANLGFFDDIVVTLSSAGGASSQTLRFPVTIQITALPNSLLANAYQAPAGSSSGSSASTLGAPLVVGAAYSSRTFLLQPLSGSAVAQLSYKAVTACLPATATTLTASFPGSVTTPTVAPVSAACGGVSSVTTTTVELEYLAERTSVWQTLWTAPVTPFQGQGAIVSQWIPPSPIGFSLRWKQVASANPGSELWGLRSATITLPPESYFTTTAPNAATETMLLAVPSQGQCSTFDRCVAPAAYNGITPPSANGCRALGGCVGYFPNAPANCSVPCYFGGQPATATAMERVSCPGTVAAGKRWVDTCSQRTPAATLSALLYGTNAAAAGYSATSSLCAAAADSGALQSTAIPGEVVASRGKDNSAVSVTAPTAGSATAHSFAYSGKAALGGGGAAFTLSPTLLPTSYPTVGVAEGGSATLSLALGSQPPADVNVSLATAAQFGSRALPMVAVTPTWLQFNTTNWATPQTVTLSATTNDVSMLNRVVDSLTATPSIAPTAASTLYGAAAAAFTSQPWVQDSTASPQALFAIPYVNPALNISYMEYYLNLTTRPAVTPAHCTAAGAYLSPTTGSCYLALPTPASNLSAAVAACAAALPGSAPLTLNDDSSEGGGAGALAAAEWALLSRFAPSFPLWLSAAWVNGGWNVSQPTASAWVLNASGAWTAVPGNSSTASVLCERTGRLDLAATPAPTGIRMPTVTRTSAKWAGGLVRAEVSGSYGALEGPLRPYATEYLPMTQPTTGRVAAVPLVGTFHRPELQLSAEFLKMGGGGTAQGAVNRSLDGAYTVRLGSRPQHNVWLSLALQGAPGALNQSTLLFTPANWSKPLTVGASVAPSLGSGDPVVTLFDCASCIPAPNAVEVEVYLSALSRATFRPGYYSALRYAAIQMMTDSGAVNATASVTRLVDVEGGIASATLRIAVPANNASTIATDQFGLLGQDRFLAALSVLPADYPPHLSYLASSAELLPDFVLPTFTSVTPVPARAALISHNVATADPVYSALPSLLSGSLQYHSLPGVVITPRDAPITISKGDYVAYTIQLAAQPRNNVTVSMFVSGGAPGDLVFTPSELVFTRGDWAHPRQIVLVSSISSTAANVTRYTISHTVWDPASGATLTQAATTAIDVSPTPIQIILYPASLQTVADTLSVATGTVVAASVAASIGTSVTATVGAGAIGSSGSAGSIISGGSVFTLIFQAQFMHLSSLLASPLNTTARDVRAALETDLANAEAAVAAALPNSAQALRAARTVKQIKGFIAAHKQKAAAKPATTGYQVLMSTFGWANLRFGWFTPNNKTPTATNILQDTFGAWALALALIIADWYGLFLIMPYYIARGYKKLLDSEQKRRDKTVKKGKQPEPPLIDVVNQCAREDEQPEMADLDELKAKVCTTINGDVADKKLAKPLAWAVFPFILAEAQAMAVSIVSALPVMPSGMFRMLSGLFLIAYPIGLIFFALLFVNYMLIHKNKRVRFHRSIRIFVEILGRDSDGALTLMALPLVVKPHQSVAALREQIAAAKGITVDEQVLLHQGAPMDESLTLIQHAKLRMEAEGCPPDSCAAMEKASNNGSCDVRVCAQLERTFQQSTPILLLRASDGLTAADREGAFETVAARSSWSVARVIQVMKDYTVQGQWEDGPQVKGGKQNNALNRFQSFFDLYSGPPQSSIWAPLFGTWVLFQQVFRSIIIGALDNAHAVTQGWLVMLLAFVHLALLMRAFPYNDVGTNFGELATAFSAFVTLFLNLVQMGNPGFTQHASNIMVVVNFVVVILLLIQRFFSILQKITSKYDSMQAKKQKYTSMPQRMKQKFLDFKDKYFGVNQQQQDKVNALLQKVDLRIQDKPEPVNISDGGTVVVGVPVAEEKGDTPAAAATLEKKAE